MPIAARADFESRSERAAKGIYVGDNTVLCRVGGAWPMYVDGRDTSLAHHLILNGYWESWITLAIANAVQPGWRCLDVGANYGYFALVMAHCGAEVLAVEANDALCELMGRTFAANGLLGRCIAVTGAAWCVSGQPLNLQIPPKQQLGGAYLAETAGSSISSDRQRLVRSLTLDDLCAGFDRIDLIKIDAEGSEPQIWQGMQETVEKYSPIIVMEFSPTRYADAPGFLADMIRVGYKPHAIDGAARVSVEPLSEGKILESPEFEMLWLQK